MPISVSMRPIDPPSASGSSSRAGGTPARCAMLRATGMNTATAPVLLMKAESSATPSISNASSRTSLLPAMRSSA